MKFKACLFSFIFYVVLLQSIFISVAGAANRIMPLGDSITQGTSSGVADEEFQVSYRKALYDKLKAAGYVVNNEIFVGTLVSGESVANFDPDHDGHPGWRTDEIVAGRPGSSQGKLAEWLTTEKPNIVLLHIGTNDVSFSNEGWNEVEDVLVVIDDYEATSGKAVWVILSLIIDRSCDPYLPPCPKSSETSTFNNNVENFVFFPRQNGGDKIVLVNMQSDAGIHYDRWDMGGDMWDTLHPFETGYDQMADLWFTGLMDILPQANAGPDQSVHEFDNVTMDASGSIDPKNGNLSYQWVQTAGTSVVLTGAQTAQPNFVAPDVGPGGETLTFKVTVTDEDDLESTDRVDIEVVLEDNCPNDPNKLEPGICGCGIADIDSDGDGTPDCNDNCPDDPNKTVPGICGCGVADVDTNGDGTLDCVETIGENDGVPDIEEQGPAGNDPNYDGNDDGVADRLQDNVTSLHTYDTRTYVTIESPAGTSISNGKTVDNPAATNAPSDVSFTDGFFEFTIIGVSKGGATTVRLHFPVGTTFATYYKFGPTADNSQNHWYEFIYNGQTGADINGNIITLHLVDGLSGDDDLMNNGIIVDVGGPGNFAAVGDIGSGADGSGGGGGCFISIAGNGFPGSSATMTLILLLGSMLISLSAPKLQKKPEK